MATKTQKLINIAKKTKEKNKNVDDVLKEENLSKDEKAKKVAEKIIEEVEFDINKKDDILELDEEKMKNNDWLEEQIELLRKENEELKKQLNLVQNESVIEYKKKLISFINEVQDVYSGKKYGQRFFDMNIKNGLIPKMVKLFPFLSDFVKI